MNALSYALRFTLLLSITPCAHGDDLIQQVLMPPGFELRLVHQVDPRTQGSWVCLALAPEGRLLASDQFGGIFLVTPGEASAGVEKLPLDLGMAQGMCVARGDLYVVVNGFGDRKSGLYRARDTDNDGLWDTAEMLRELSSGGEHGPHAVIPAPGRDGLLIACGNITRPTEFAASRVPHVWQEDVLMPVIDDPPRMFSKLRAPGGWIAKTDFNGNAWELQAMGFRNQYDIALDANGELFTFDADNEFDIDTPWYRPTRVCHVVSGAEFGWRHGSGKWPTYYEDSVPPAIDVGPGSPTGLTFGYGTRFPHKYQRALFAADWSHGRVFAVRLTPEGGSFSGVLEPFLSGSPLPVTDLVVNPTDGALYLTTGGRRVASALWRVVYTGDEPTTPVPQLAEAPTPEAIARKKLESLHAPSHADSEDAVSFAWSKLGDPDRAIRFAARTAIELRPYGSWCERAFEEPSPERRAYAMLAAARCCGGERLAELHSALRETDPSELDTTGLLAYLRAVSLCHIRYDPIEPDARNAIINALLAELPHPDERVNHQTAALLLALGGEQAVPKTLSLMADAPLATDRLHYCYALAQAKTGWDREGRRAYYRALLATLRFAQNRTMQAYVDRITEIADGNLDDAARQEVADLIALRASLSEPQEVQERPLVRKWKLDEVVRVAEAAGEGFDEKHGRRLFSEAQCFQCHRFDGRGGAVGPDLSAVGRRYSAKDIATALVDPNATVSDQYRQTAYTVDGRTIVGRIVNLQKGQVMIATDFTDPKNYVTVKQADIEEAEPVANSPMPSGLLDVLNEEELRDLLGYLRAGGD